jgi:hypothetical protein
MRPVQIEKGAAMDADGQLFSRERALSGRPAKRASTLLYLIESRTAYLVARSQQDAAEFITEESAQERSQAFLEAFALGREPPRRPTIQELEQYARQWAGLVPENPRLRAALAHNFGQKYAFTHRSVPAIRAALGLDTEAVQQAYQSLYDQPLERIYVSQVKLTDRLRWLTTGFASWLEGLSPFWKIFVLTVTFNTTQAFLALPIALSGLGPLAGIGLVVILGLFNILTMTAMAEAVGRNGGVRYGGSYLGRLVSDYLGPVGAGLLTFAVGIRSLLGVLTNYIGLANTLAATTPIPALIWAPVVFFLGMALMAQGALNLEVSLTVFLGLLNLALVGLLSLLTLPYFRLENLSAFDPNLLTGAGFDVRLLQQAFGPILFAYFGHAYLSQFARQILPQDKSIRALVWGSIAGMAAVVAILSIWVLMVTGATGTEVLRGATGTALTPLAARIGPLAQVLGLALVALLLGMATLRNSTVVVGLMREQLPAGRQLVRLPRRQGQACFALPGREGDDEALVGLTYLGLAEGQPHFRLDVQADGRVQRVETTISRQWDGSTLAEQVPSLRQRDFRLSLEVVEASPTAVQLQVNSPLKLTYRGGWDATGLRLGDFFALPDEQQALVAWIMRQEEAVSAAQVSAELEEDEYTTELLLSSLVEQGLLREEAHDGQVRYQASLAPRRRSRLSRELWQTVSQGLEGGTVAPAPRWQVPERVARATRETLASERGRFWLSVSPIVLIFLVTEWLILTQQASYTRPISIVGVLVSTIMGGIFPMLLLVSSRQRGECIPGQVFRTLGHPLVVAGVCIFYLAILLLHGLVIWQNPVERFCALGSAFITVVAILFMARQGAFSPRLVVELREDQRPDEPSEFAVTLSSTPLPAEVSLAYDAETQQHRAASGQVPAFTDLRQASFLLPASRARDLKVWGHRITANGESESLPALLLVEQEGETREFDLKLLGGQAIVPLRGKPCRVQLTLAEPSRKKVAGWQFESG